MLLQRSTAVAILVGTFVFRWATIDFDNDYFMHVAWAAAMLRGEWPVRDFVEPGFILQTLVAYIGFGLGGYQLLWEGALACALISTGALLLFVTSRRLGISLWLAVAAVVLAVASYPRLYAYPKAFVYPAALWAIALYVTRPSTRALTLLAGVTALAFLFRHDHGAWIGVVSALALALAHWQPRAAVKAIATYAGITLAMTAPWLLWVAVSGHAAQYAGFLSGQSQGLVTNRFTPAHPLRLDRSAPLVALAPVDFPQVGIRWAAGLADDERQRLEARYGLEPLADAGKYRLLAVDAQNVRALIGDPAVEDTSGIDRGSLRVPSGLVPWAYLQTQRYVPPIRLRLLPGLVNAANAQAWLTYVSFAVPWIALAAALALLAQRQARDLVAVRAIVIPAAVLSMIVYQTLVRGSADSRLGDIAAITALLLAWICARAWTQQGRAALWLKPLVAVALALTLGSAVSYGKVVDRLAGAGVDGPANLARRIGDVRERYASRPLDVFAPPGVTGLPALARWLHECTTADERVSVIGFEPQLFVVAERGFAGGMAFYDLAWASGGADQQLTVERWSRQRVPFVLAMASEWGSFSRDYPRVRGWIDEHYDELRRSSFGGNKDVIVLRARSFQAAGTHGGTGLPCTSSAERATRRDP